MSVTLSVLSSTLVTKFFRGFFDIFENAQIIEYLLLIIRKIKRLQSITKLPLESLHAGMSVSFLVYDYVYIE